MQTLRLKSHYNSMIEDQVVTMPIVSRSDQKRLVGDKFQIFRRDRSYVPLKKFLHPLPGFVVLLEMLIQYYT